MTTLWASIPPELCNGLHAAVCRGDRGQFSLAEPRTLAGARFWLCDWRLNGRSLCDEARRLGCATAVIAVGSIRRYRRVGVSMRRCLTCGSTSQNTKPSRWTIFPVLHGIGSLKIGPV